jgi:hypothetical protein
LRFKGADAGQRLTHVANLIFANTAFAGQERRSKLGQVVAVGRSQADAGDNDPLRSGQVLWRVRRHEHV